MWKNTNMRIKEVIESKGMTISQVADKMGITVQSLYSIIKGNPTVSNLEKIAIVLDCNIAELFEEPKFLECPHCGKKIILKKGE